MVARALVWVLSIDEGCDSGALFEQHIAFHRGPLSPERCGGRFGVMLNKCNAVVRAHERLLGQ